MPMSATGNSQLRLTSGLPWPSWKLKCQQQGPAFLQACEAIGWHEAAFFSVNSSNIFIWINQGSPSQVGKYADHIDTKPPSLQSRIYLNTRSSMIPMEIHGFTCFVVLRGSSSWGQLPPGGIEPGSWLFRSPTPALRKPATYRSICFKK